MKALSGLDALLRDNFQQLAGMAVSIVCNQATIASDLRHLLDHFLKAHNSGKVRINSVLGPQHGLWGHTQDNMVEWEGTTDERFPFPIYSLYGGHREPTEAMLQGSDCLVLDLPDVGSRYYTFIWTMALCLKKCEEMKLPMVVLDRPNPIGGKHVEGTVLEPDFASFVGLHPLPARHGMTLGEIARYLRAEFFPNLDLRVVACAGWSRNESFEQTKLPWTMPSPNMPHPDTALVYPGGCIIEGTLLSEGRGTTRPFEIVGAPFIDAWEYCSALNSAGLRGVYFRPIQFEPTFQKHAQIICEGAFVHVTDREFFKPFLTYVAIVQEAIRLYSSEFEWKSPPYEYEFTRLPFDILAGNRWLRSAIEDLRPLQETEDRLEAECAAFEPVRQKALLYV